MHGEYINAVKQTLQKRSYFLTEGADDPATYTHFFIGWVVSKLSIDPLSLKDETIDSIADEFVSEVSALVGPEIEDADLNLAEFKNIVSTYGKKAVEASKGEEGGEEAPEETPDAEEAPEAEVEPEAEPAPAKSENPAPKAEEKPAEKPEDAEGEEKDEEEDEGEKKENPFAKKSTKTECAKSLSNIKTPKPVKLTSIVKGPKPFKK